jgi:uncharacterized metal-binding protein YceD (DUF177 family)
VSVDAFEAVFRIRRAARDVYVCEAHFEADLVQSCVVTLEPVSAHVAGDFERRLEIRRVRARAAPPAGVAAESAGDDDDTEILSGSVTDLAVPLLEEFALCVDPYPRKASAEFVATDDAATLPENPFAILEKLKAAD